MARLISAILFAASSLAAAETVSKSALIELPLGKTFDTATTAKFWPRWHPATLSVTGDVDHPMKAGDRLRERARIAGMLAEGEWTVSESRRPRTLVLSMPGSKLGDLEIRYRFERVHRRLTRFTRELTFDPSGFPPAVAGAVREQMNRDSAEAVENLKKLLESGRART